MNDDLDALVRQVLAEVVALRREVAASPQPKTSLRLEDCGDVVTLAELGRLLGYSPRYGERLVTLERRTGVRILPPSLAGAPGRYLRRDVEQWLRRGGPTRRVVKRAGRADDTGRL